MKRHIYWKIVQNKGNLSNVESQRRNFNCNTNNRLVLFEDIVSKEADNTEVDYMNIEKNIIVR